LLEKVRGTAFAKAGFVDQDVMFMMELEREALPQSFKLIFGDGVGRPRTDIVFEVHK
jgi:hypothetical protein